MSCGSIIHPSATPRSCFRVLACAVVMLAIVADAALGAAAPICKPALTFKDVKFSAVNWETMIRKWTATVMVDASRCAPSSGWFEVLFMRQKENGPKVDFTERFEWKTGATEVAVDFWADEAVESYRVTRITDCSCQR